MIAGISLSLVLARSDMALYGVGDNTHATMINIRPLEKSSQGVWTTVYIGPDFMVHETEKHFTVLDVEGQAFVLRFSGGEECKGTVLPPKGQWRQMLRITCPGWPKHQLYESITEVNREGMVREIQQEAARERGE